MNTASSSEGGWFDSSLGSLNSRPLVAENTAVTMKKMISRKAMSAIDDVGISDSWTLDLTFISRSPAPFAAR